MVGVGGGFFVCFRKFCRAETFLKVSLSFAFHLVLGAELFFIADYK